MSMHTTHIFALVSAALWRHLRVWSLGIRLLRLSVPLLLVGIVGYLRSIKLNDFKFLRNLGLDPSSARAAKEQLEKLGTEEYFTAMLDVLFAASVLVVILFAFILFVQQVVRESANGTRNLLHSMGLSRYAYWLVTIGLEGVLQTFTEAILMVLAARFCANVRLASSTPVLLGLGIFALTVSSAFVGSLLSFTLGHSKTSTALSLIVASLIGLLAMICSGVSAWSDQHLLQLTASRLGFALVCPVVPAFHILVLLAKSCSANKCMTLHAVSKAWQAKGFLPLLDLNRSFFFGGSSKAQTNATIPDQLVDLLQLVAAEIFLAAVIVILMDVRAQPPLRHRAGQPKEAGTFLEVQDLVHRYSWLPGAEYALNGVNFVLKPGGILGVLGPNGAGKTTCIKCITGQELPQQGAVVLRPPSQSYSSHANMNIGLCPQDTVVIDDLTVEEHFSLFAAIKSTPRSERMQCVEHFLEKTKLTDKRHAFPSELSGGLRRRLAVGSALIGRSSLTFLDEPTTGLDPVSRRGTWAAIAAASNDESCVLLTTHMLEEAEELCSDIVILAKGKVATKGSVQELKDTFGTGYLLNVDTQVGQESAVRTYLASVLPDERSQPVKVSQTGQMLYQVGRDAKFVGQLFLTLAEDAASNGIRRWGISQASLEDAYVRIITGEE